MDVTTAQLYDLLVEKGFDKEQVRDALSEIATSKELDARLVNLEDRLDARLSQLETKLYRAMMLQTGAIAAIVFGKLQFVV